VFVTRGSANRHGETHNEKMTMYPCPLAEEYGCEQVFGRKEAAERHVQTQHSLVSTRYPCPEAAQFGCQLDFSSTTKATQHAKLHTHPIVCSRQGCNERFKTMGDALAYETNPDHVAVSASKLFVCTVPNCRINVAGKRLVNKTTSDRHMQMHVSYGHVQNSDEYPPRQVEDVFQHSRHLLYWQIYANNLSDEDESQKHQGGACDVIEASRSVEIALEHSQHASKEKCETQDNSPYEVPEEELLSLQPLKLSEERRRCIMETNRAVWGMFTLCYDSSYRIH
jgi:hypothetical protein